MEWFGICFLIAIIFCCVICLVDKPCSNELIDRIFGISQDHNNNNSGVPLFKLVSIALALLALIIGYLTYFGGHGELGSQYYKGNIDTFSNDTVERAKSISTMIEIFVCGYGIWFVLLISRMVRKR